MRAAMGIAALAMAGLATPGCRVETEDPEPCTYTEERCDVEGDTLCADDGTLRICSDYGRCLVWLSVPCGDGRRCVEAEPAACVCEEECDAEGVRRCSGTWLEECYWFEDSVVEESSCFGWRQIENCADSGTTCIESQESANCDN